MTSNVRENFPMVEGDLGFEAEGDLAPFVIFTQLKSDGPFLYAGWVDAVDAAMAISFAREHYGQDQLCTALWAVNRDDITGTAPEFPASGDPGAARSFTVFTQTQPGDGHDSHGTIEATCGADALAQAVARLGDSFNSLWVVETGAIAEAGEDELIWRHTDQTYRLARGYAKDVRLKWEHIRKLNDLETYERDDIKETF